MARIAVYNPSDYPRVGHVSVPWSEVARTLGPAAEGPLVVRDASGQVLPAQVERAGADGERGTLHVTVRTPLPPGTEHYGTVSEYLSLEPGEAPDTDGDRDEDARPRVEVWLRGANGRSRYDDIPDKGADEVVNALGFHLINERYNVWFETGAHDGQSFLAGSATSVVLDGLEVLDAFRGREGPEDHHPEKRAMQIDLVTVSRPASEPEQLLTLPFHTGRYQLLSCSQGPVRASATMVSQPFDYTYADPFAGVRRTLSCRMYRTLSLHRDADWVGEEVRLRAVPEEGPPDRGVNLYFVPRYFCHMNMGRDARMTRFDNVPDWLAISYPSDPFQGYGFATDAHTAQLRWPHPGYPYPDSIERTFSWELGITNGCRCVHIFKLCPPETLVDRAGRAWYELIYKPLRATVEE